MELYLLYEQSVKGEKSALNELNSLAGAGNHQAQYLLSCIYDNPDCPFFDRSLGMYWLKKSAEYGNANAIKKIDGLTKDLRSRYDMDEVKNSGINQNSSSSSSYTSHWSVNTLEYIEDSGCLQRFSWVFRGLLVAIAVSIFHLCTRTY